MLTPSQTAAARADEIIKDYMVDNPDADNVCDLIADIFHWITEHPECGFDVESAIDRATMYFKEDNNDA